MFWTIVLGILFIIMLPNIILLILCWACLLLAKFVDGVWYRYESHKKQAKIVAYWITCIVWWILMFLLMKNFK